MRMAQGIPTTPESPLCPSLHPFGFSREDGGLGTQLYIMVRAATEGFPTYTKIQLAEIETQQIQTGNNAHF